MGSPSSLLGLSCFLAIFLYSAWAGAAFPKVLPSPPLISSPHLSSPLPTSPHLSQPLLTSPHLSSPHLSPPHFSSPLPTSHLSPYILTSPPLSSRLLTNHQLPTLPLILLELAILAFCEFGPLTGAPRRSP